MPVRAVTRVEPAEAPSHDEVISVEHGAPPPRRDLQERPRIIALPVRNTVTDDRGAAPDAPDPPAPDAQAHPAPVFIGGTQRIAFFSLKGGVGKTTLAVETAVHLARHGHWRASAISPPQPLKVALLDLDMRSANVAMKLGLTHPTLWDLMTGVEPGRADIDTCLLTHHPSGLRVLLGPPRSVTSAEARALAIERLARVISRLEEDGCHLVFMDLGSEVNELTTYLMEAAQRICYVMTPTASSVQDVYRGAETLGRMGHRRKLRLVLNQVRGTFDAGEMLGDLGCGIDARIRHDEAFVEAENRHRPASLGGLDAGIGDLAAAIYPALGPAAITRRRLWHRLLRRPA